VSRERVRQIITKWHGLRADDGGQSAKARMKRARHEAKREAACLRQKGCSTAEYRGLQAIGRGPNGPGPVLAFTRQRSTARARGIEWNLTLWDWWLIWQDSGKWAERGRAGDAYVMCRFKDEGAYAIGNVYIATLRHNSTVQPNNRNRKGHPDFEVSRKRMRENGQKRASRGSSYKPVNPGLPVGVTKHKGRYIAQCRVNGANKYLGSFGSPEDAHSAYLDAVKSSQEAA
jgi:hypothetical protein